MQELLIMSVSISDLFFLRIDHSFRIEKILLNIIILTDFLFSKKYIN